LNKTIEVIVLPDGKTKVQTKGFSGADCKQASKFLEAALGQVRSDRLTDEYFCTQHTQQLVREGR
jgi:hypothetical protein